MPHVVLEGAPGQGKSTVAQYICQVHRMKLLRDPEALSAIPDEHQSKGMRLPIKVDLRDFAAWLGKKDPFSADPTADPPANWRKSLESFLASFISAYSGGTNFSPDDLIAVPRISSILCVLDGLDEVADIAIRQEVVEELVKGVQRLEANAASLQTIVTSRPAAFANSPGMPPEKYPYLHLGSLSRPLINQYADRWLKARRVDSKEAAEFKKTLKEKLDQPHLRDLARNPMQLAILLSLITTRGMSLPDKRTALYDNYVDLFFNREAEKSSVVREHRDLLIDIHRYLAWLLHSEAERGSTRGSISQERLQSVLRNYLGKEGYDPSWAQALFAGMVERVVALVSRVEGTFEFEVQPLREYFAARFLYDTAPYSPPGGEQRGTKPDRFDALARNFYWTNVTRFYAGCFSKGELPGLVERLQELSSDAEFRLTTHPRMLGATLLSDWVFTQNPKSVQSVVTLILDGIGFRYLVAAGASDRRRRGIWNPVVLPPKCGNDQLVAACFAILSKTPPVDYALDVLELVRANAPANVLLERWREAFDSSKRLKWLNYGVHLGVLPLIDLNELEQLVNNKIESAAQILYRARRTDFFESSEQRFNLAVGAVLAGNLLAQPQRRVESAIDALAQAVNVVRYGLAFRQRVPLPLSRVFAQRHGLTSFKWPPDLTTNTETYTNHKNCLAFAEIAEEMSQRSAAEWATELDPWNQIVETGRRIWGDQWVFYSLATLSAGIKSNVERAKEADELFDASRPLCSRTRHARLRSVNNSWWQEQFRNVTSEDDAAFACLVAFCWARPDVLVSMAVTLDNALNRLSQEKWVRVYRAIRRTTAWGYTRSDERIGAFDVDSLPAELSPRTVVALGPRATTVTSRNLYLRFLSEAASSDDVVLDFILEEALDASSFSTDSWSPDLARIRHCYATGSVSVGHPFFPRSNRKPMPLSIAAEIAGNPEAYPTALLEAAEEACRRNVARKAKAVATVSEDEGWFGQQRPGKLFDV